MLINRKRAIIKKMNRKSVLKGLSAITLVGILLGGDESPNISQKINYEPAGGLTQEQMKDGRTAALIIDMQDPFLYDIGTDERDI